MAKMLLLNHQHPRLGILVTTPVRGYRRFKDGRLEVSSDDPAYAELLKIATKRSDVTIVGEVADAGGEIRQRSIKSAAQFSCDVCSPTQTFESEVELASHTRALHAAAPATDAEGNDVVGVNRGAARTTTIAPARRKKR